MPAERYFTQHDLYPDAEVVLEDKEFHHLRVMRTKEGDEVELVNGRGILAKALLQCTEKHKAILHVQSTVQEAPSNFQVIIAQALPRINRLDFIIEKGTELGMNELWLFPGQHSERHQLSNQQQAHIQAVAVAAMKQCGRLTLPVIRLLPELKAWNTLEYPAFYGDVDPSAFSFSKKLEELKPKEGLLFFIGPEAGFHPNEEAKLQQLGCHGVKLHQNVLRTDTASLVALSLISSYCTL